MTLTATMKVKDLLRVLKHLSVWKIRTVQLNVDGGGNIRCSSVDPTNVCMYEVTIPIQKLSKDWWVDAEFSIIVDLKLLTLAVKRFAATSDIELELAPDGTKGDIRITCGGCMITLPENDTTINTHKLPDLLDVAYASVNVMDMQRVLKIASGLNPDVKQDHVKITVDYDGVVLSRKRLKEELKNTVQWSSAIPTPRVQCTCLRSTYMPMEYMTSLFATLSGDVTLCVDEDYPLLVKSNSTSDITYSYFIAPIIPCEDD